MTDSKTQSFTLQMVSAKLGLRYPKFGRHSDMLEYKGRKVDLLLR
ncbi:MAG: hypothetical protein ACN4E2_06910 [Nitrospinota bacterium]